MTTGNTWNWGKITHNTKTVMQAGLAMAFVVLAGTAVYAAAKGTTLSLAFLANPAVVATIVSLVAVYFIVAALSSYFAEKAQGKDGVSGKDGKDASFAALVSGVLKSGTIAEETVKDANQKDVKQLNLKLSKDAYEALTKGKNENDEVILHVLLKNKSVEVKFNHVAAANDNGNYKVTLTSPTDKKDLEMADNSSSLKVAVSDKDFETLKTEVPTKLADVAIKEAVSKITSK